MAGGLHVGMMKDRQRQRKRAGGRSRRPVCGRDPVRIRRTGT
jgi:hypothetical protein